MKSEKIDKPYEPIGWTYHCELETIPLETSSLWVKIFWRFMQTRYNARSCLIASRNKKFPLYERAWFYMKSLGNGLVSLGAVLLLHILRKVKS